MRIFTEDQYFDIEAIADSAVRKYEAAKAYAAAGVHIFPASAYDGESFAKAHAEYLASQDTPKKLPQRHYKQYGGKAPAFGGQYDKATCVMSQIEQWWHPTKGRYRGNNICVSTGKDSGLVIVDLDVKPDEGVDGFAWWNNLIAEHGDVDTFRVRSGGESTGGQHLYFKYREGCFTSNGFAPGVDIRVETSHVVGAFSECQGVYTAIVFDEVADMPDWLHGVLARTGGSDKHAHRPSDKQRQEFDVTPLDQIEEMLEWIDPNDPDVDMKWKNIMYAVHSEHPTDEGLAVIQRWSEQNADRFEPGNNEDLWNRAHEDRQSGATINTLYHIAEECGWINPRRSSESVDIITAVRMMNRSFAIIDPDRCMLDAIRRGKTLDRSKMPPVFVPSMTIYKTRSVLTSGARQDHQYSKTAEVNVAQIGMMTASYKVPTVVNGKPGKPRTLYDVWLGSPARKSYASAGFYINNSRCPDGVLNLFPGFKVRPKKGFPKMFMRHIQEVVCDGDVDRARWIINRLAYVVQYGDEIASTALAVTGEQGSGKTIVADYMGEVLGELSYKYLHDSNGLDTRFSEEIVGKFIICADEAIFAGDPKLRNKMKSLISATVLRDEGKGKAVKDAQNVMFLMIMSNEDEPVSIERGDRRFTVMKTNNKYSKTSREKSKEVDDEAREYFRELVREMKGDGPAMLLDMLQGWEVDKALARTALDTQEKQVMAEKRVLKCDSVTAYMLHLYITGFETDDKDDLNSLGEGWGGRSQMGPFHSTYREWCNDQRHRNGEWKAEDARGLRNRLINDFGCTFIAPKNKSTICWPPKANIRESLAALIPEAISELDEYDASQEKDF